MSEQLPARFPLQLYGMMRYRKVPAECFEHLHLVSLTVHVILRSVRLSSGAYSLANLYPAFPSEIILAIIYRRSSFGNCLHTAWLPDCFSCKKGSRNEQLPTPGSSLRHRRRTRHYLIKMIILRVQKSTIDELDKFRFDRLYDLSDIRFELNPIRSLRHNTN